MIGHHHRIRNSRMHSAKGVLASVVFAGLLLGRCNGPPAGSGDPGNVRLHMLRADPVFSELHPQSHLLQPIKSEPATWRPTIFEAGGWDSPLVELIFHSNLPVAQVAAFYNARAQAAGWHLDQLTNGMPGSWSKDYPGKISADLLFSYGTSVPGSDTYGPNGTYELAGNISPKWG